MPTPPPVPPPTAPAIPPPKSKLAVWFSHPVIIAAVAVAACGALIVGWAALYFLTAKDMALTASQEACVITADDLDDWFAFKIDPAAKTWTAKRHFDGSVEIDYTFDDPAPGVPYLNCNLTIERKLSDAAMTYSTTWGGYKIGGNLAAAATVKVVPADHIFSWGDASHFSFLEVAGSNHGFGFVARKGTKIFFLSVGGAALEDPAEVEAFLLPALKRFDLEPF